MNALRTSVENVEIRVGPARSPYVCPWWLGSLMACPIRKLIESPEKMLGSHARPGMSVLDFGCAMGYFSLPLARMVGEDGRVVCVDLQERMIAGLKRRARKAGLLGRVETVLCGPEDLGLVGRDAAFDLIVAMYVIHEVPNPPRAFAQLAAALKPGGRMVFAEPKGHVSEKKFSESLGHAARSGLHMIDRLAFRRARAALLEKSIDA
jgi:2-polyprenyl-3-methyl-5-hydroxy-6-metoxy-1,4-benzoquinol methylase